MRQEETVATETQPFRMGPWRIDPALNRIQDEQGSVQLEPKVMALLHHLAQAEGRLVPKNDLKKSVWGNVHVAEGALKHLVWELRKALGDDARRPRFIETIAKRGYRLLAPIEECAIDSPRPMWAAKANTAGWISGGILGLTVVVAILLALQASIDWDRSPFSNADQIRLHPLSSQQGNEIDPSLSPDGTQAVFAWDAQEPGQYDIYRQGIDESTPRQLTSHPAPETSPAWSPDGERIVFIRDASQPDDQLMVMSSQGGSPHVLAQGLGDIRDVAWAPDGSHLVISTRPDGHYINRLGRLSYPQGRLSWLTDPPARSSGDRDPSFSPDGSRIAFRRSLFGGGDVLYTIPASGGTPRLVARDHSLILGLTWSRDGRDVIFSSDRRSPRSLWAIRTDGGRALRLPLTAGFPADPWMSPGGRLIFQVMSCDTNLWRIAIPEDGAATSQPRRQLASSTQVDRSPQFSPDGRRLAFVSTRSGHQEIWITDLEDGQPWKAASLQGPSVNTLRWSRDGRRLVFDAASSDQIDLFLLMVDTGSVRQLTDDTDTPMQPSWSHDDRWVYFASHQTGEWQVWRRDLEGRTQQVTQSGGYGALEDSRGRFLYYTRRGESGIWRKSLDGNLETSAELRLLDEPSNLDIGDWTLRSGHIFYVSSHREGRFIRSYSLDSGTSRRLLRLGRNWSPYSGLDVSPDRKTLVLTRLDSSQSDLMLMEDSSR